MIKDIYVVTGVSTDYEDSNSWVVKAFDNERSAEDFVDLAQQHSDNIFEKLRAINPDSYEEVYTERENAKSPVDPHFQQLTYRTSYYVVKTTLELTYNDY